MYGVACCLAFTISEAGQSTDVETKVYLSPSTCVSCLAEWLQAWLKMSSCTAQCFLHLPQSTAGFTREIIHLQ